MRYGVEDHRELGTFLVVELTGGVSHYVPAILEDGIVLAMRNWIDSDRDTLLTLQLIDGDAVHVAASDVRHVSLSTARGRDRSHEVNCRLRAIEADDDKEGWEVGRPG